MATQWSCSACTYTNSLHAAVCQICLTARGAGLVAAAVTASNASGQQPANTMTPTLLSQTWRSYGRTSRITSVTVFSQPTIHIFSNYVTHPPVTMSVPPYCNSAALASAGRKVEIQFEFAEKAIMACKAALFRDYKTFDRIMGSANSREAKTLGRQVSPFDQNVWDAHQCSIVRHVTIAKLGWADFRSTLLQTGNSTIAECTRGDWVWGTALDRFDKNVQYPGRWEGINILGWSLMEARDEARKVDSEKEKEKVSHFTPPSPTAAAAATPKRQRLVPNDEKLDPNSIKYLATQYSFGPNAFGPLQRSAPIQHATNLPDLSGSVRDIVESSVPEAKNMRGERGNKYVTRMLTDIYRQGLFMHGSPDSNVNQTVIPAFRHIVSELDKLDAQDAKRVTMVRNLAEACQDCQQVQARVILRMYGDLTSQTETFESQLKYSLVRSKEAALQILITKYHSPSCDLDHTMVEPQNQRAHLWSGYVALVGDVFGLDGIGAANGDRFLSDCLGVIRNVHSGTIGSSSATCGGSLRFSRQKSVDDEALKRSLMGELTQNISVKEWLSSLIGDINNQSTNADRMIDRSCIFAWASANMGGDFKHRIFHDEARGEEYSDLHPNEPIDDNKYEPFLSPLVLVEMLVKAGMLQRKI